MHLKKAEVKQNKNDNIVFDLTVNKIHVKVKSSNSRIK